MSCTPFQSWRSRRSRSPGRRRGRASSPCEQVGRGFVTALDTSASSVAGAVPTLSGGGHRSARRCEARRRPGSAGHSGASGGYCVRLDDVDRPCLVRKVDLLQALRRWRGHRALSGSTMRTRRVESIVSWPLLGKARRAGRVELAELLELVVRAIVGVQSRVAGSPCRGHRPRPVRLPGRCREVAVSDLLVRRRRPQARELPADPRLGLLVEAVVSLAELHPRSAERRSVALNVSSRASTWPCWLKMRRPLLAELGLLASSSRAFGVMSSRCGSRRRGPRSVRAP